MSLGKLLSGFCEIGSRYEDALRRFVRAETTAKIPNVGFANGVVRIILFRLYIDAVKPQLILVNAPSIPPSPVLPSARPASIRDPPKPIFKSKSTTRRSKNAGDAAQIRGIRSAAKALSTSFIVARNSSSGVLSLRAMSSTACGTMSAGGVARSPASDKGVEFVEPPQKLCINPFDVLGQDRAAAFCDFEKRAPRRYQQLSFNKILLRPMDSVVKDGLLPARQKLFAFDLSQHQLAREKIDNVGHPVFVAVARQLQHRQHQ
jgi:hypothetical protein